MHPARRIPFDELIAGLEKARAAGHVGYRECPAGRRLYIYTNRCVYENGWDRFLPARARIYYILMLGLFAVIGWAQLKVGKAGRSRPELFLMFCDLALLTFIAIVPNPWSTANWPIGMRFRFDTFIYFFILLSTATLAYSWRTVVAMGFWTSGLWVVGVGWAYLQPETHAALSERVRAAIRLRHQNV